MGFLRRLFGAKKPGPPSDGSCSKSDKDSNKKKWSFVKQGNRRKSLPPPPPQPTVFTQFDTSTSLERNKHAIAVAAATAAVAEAALAAAHAAAEVVRLTSNGVGGSSAVSRQKARVEQPRLPEENAAVIIQSGFRGYLARRALRALKALVKLQALVRGHIVRKQSADMLRRMQTLVKLQTQARATRSHLSSSSDNLHCFKSSLYHYPVPEEHEHPHPVYSAKFGGSSILKRCSSNATIRKNESEKPRFGPNWLDHWMQDNSCNQIKDTSSKNRHTNNQKIDKILEVDTWKPHDSPSKHSIKPQNQSVSRTADNSPQTFSASSKTGNGAKRGTTTPFTPTRSECSWSFLGGYSGYPNYMANTESSRAKVRSQSAPKQRLEFERCGSTRRPFQGLWDIGSNNSDQDSEYSRTNKVSPALSRFNRIGSSNNLR